MKAQSVSMAWPPCGLVILIIRFYHLVFCTSINCGITKQKQILNIYFIGFVQRLCLIEYKQRFRFFSIIAHDPNNPFRSDLFIASLDATIPNSLDYLHRIVAPTAPDNASADAEQFVSLSYDSFTAITSANPARHRQSFDQMTPISLTELRCQIYFDLCTFYLHAKQYDQARDNAMLCRKSLVDLKREYVEKRDGKVEFLFCTIDESELDGCLMACGVGDRSQIGLLHRMNASRLNGFIGLTEILHEDNVRQEIPLANRRILELDIECMGSVSGLAPNLLIQVAALNCIRSTLEPLSLLTYNDFLIRHRTTEGLAVLAEFVSTVLPRLSNDQKLRLRKLFQDLLVTSTDVNAEAKLVAKSGVLTADELADAQRQHSIRVDDFELPAIVHLVDWKISECKCELRGFGLFIHSFNAYCLLVFQLHVWKWAHCGVS